MRLDELIGTRRFQDRGFWSVLDDFKKAGGEHVGSGRFAHVIGHRSWPYVLKVFAEDWCYRAFVEWAIENPHPCLPRFYGKPKAITPFWKRPTRDRVMWVVKQERLNAVPQMVGETLAEMAFAAHSIMEYERLPHIDSLIRADSGARDELEMISAELKKPDVDVETKRKLRDMRRNLVADISVIADRHRRLREFWKRHPGSYEFVTMVADHLSNATIHCALDAHAGNIMMRPSDGSYVFVDPFWHGSNPYADHDAMMRAEIEGMSDDEPPMLMGRQTSLPKPRSVSPPTSWLGNDDSDIPF